MTMRKPNRAEHIKNLKIEMENHQIFLQAAVDEITELKQKDDTGLATLKDQRRAVELEKIMKDHRNWINAHKKEITDYYKPAMVMAC